MTPPAFTTGVSVPERRVQAIQLCTGPLVSSSLTLCSTKKVPSRQSGSGLRKALTAISERPRKESTTMASKWAAVISPTVCADPQGQRRAHFGPITDRGGGGRLAMGAAIIGECNVFPFSLLRPWPAGPIFRTESRLDPSGRCSALSSFHLMLALSLSTIFDEPQIDRPGWVLDEGHAQRRIFSGLETKRCGHCGGAGQCPRNGHAEANPAVWVVATLRRWSRPDSDHRRISLGPLLSSSEA